MIEVRDFVAADLDCIRAAETGESHGEIHLKWGPAATVLADGFPVACGGIHLAPQGGVAEAWAAIEPERMTPHVLLAYRGVLDGWVDRYKLRRVQAVTIFGWKEGERFMLFLRFHPEAVLQYFWPNADGALYVRLTNV